MSKKTDQWRGSNLWLGLIILLILAGCGSQSGLSDQTSSSGSSSSSQSQSSSGGVPNVVFNGRVDSTASTSVADIAAPASAALRSANANVVITPPTDPISQTISTGVVQVANVGQSTTAEPPFQGSFTVASSGQVSFYVEPFPSHCGPCTFEVSVDAQVIINSPPLLPASQGNSSFATMSSVVTIPLTAGAHTIKVVCTKADCDPATCCGCCIPGPWGRGGSWGALVTYTTPSAASLSIDGKSIPEAFDPASGGNVQLSFDLTTQGMGTNPNLTWQVSIVDSNSQAVLYPFPTAAPGPGVFTPGPGTMHVDLSWNGKDSSGTPVTPNFSWSIQAQATQGSTTKSARAEILNDGSKPAELLIQSGASERALAYSPSTADLEKAVVDPLLRRISDANETYTIEAKGLKFEGQRPNTIVAEIKSNVSGRTLLKTLTYNNTTQTFSGTFHYNEVIQPRPATTLYSTVAGNEPHFETLLSLWGNLIAGNDTQGVYPGPKAQVGQLLAKLAVFGAPNHAGLLDPALAPTIDGANADPVTGQTPDDSKNFFQYGFEAITVSLKDVTGALQTKDLQTLQRVGHAADVVVISCHGSQNGELSINPNAFFATLTPKPPIGPRPTQVVFLSCAALDLRDYNNSFDLTHFGPTQGGHPARAGLFQDTDVDPDTGATYHFTPRASYGGEAWFRSFSGQTILLGYNADVTARAVAEVTPVYRRHIAQGENALLAWLRSNREVGLTQDLGGLGWTAFNACAYDTNGDYYYIAFSPPSGNFIEIAPSFLSPGAVVPRGIYKVPGSKWSFQADDWSDALQTSNRIPLASKVE